MADYSIGRSGPEGDRLYPMILSETRFLIMNIEDPEPGCRYWIDFSRAELKFFASLPLPEDLRSRFADMLITTRSKAEANAQRPVEMKKRRQSA